MAEQPETPGRNDPPDYYDILVVGKTGMGKSMTGNKLLEVESGVSTEAKVQLWGKVVDKVKRFRTSDDDLAKDYVDSTTAECKLLSNDRNVRVLDTPGFADTRTAKDLGVLGSNLQLFRWILRYQEEKELAFRRVLYFLPCRGPLERADGVLQEEIKVMYEFMGVDFFNIMVIIATQQKRLQKHGFTEEDKEATEKVFIASFEKITGECLQQCPPVLFLKSDDRNVLHHIKAAMVIAEVPVRYTLKDPVPVKVKSSLAVEDIINKNPTKRLQFNDRCTRCAGKIIYEAAPTGKRAARIKYESGAEQPWKESKCHPMFIPKYHGIAKIVGKIIYVLSLERIKWVTDEICPVCDKPPGQPGCSKVGESAEITIHGGSKQPVLTSHSTTLDRVCVEKFVNTDEV